MQQTSLSFIVLSQLAFMRIVFQNAKFFLEGQAISQNGVKVKIKVPVNLHFDLHSTGEDPSNFCFGMVCGDREAFSTPELILLAAHPFSCGPPRLSDLQPRSLSQNTGTLLYCLLPFTSVF